MDADESRNTDDVNPPTEEKVHPVISCDSIVIFVPPDGGFAAWRVLFFAFLCNGVLMCVLNNFTVFYQYIVAIYKEEKQEDADTEISSVGSLTFGLFFLFCLPSGMVSDKLGIRPTVFLGGVIIMISLCLTAFFHTRFKVFLVSHGVLFAIGCSLAYVPSIGILSHYFGRYLGIANGVTCLGSATFSSAFPFAFREVTRIAGLRLGFIFVMCLNSLTIVCAFVFKPLIHPDIKRDVDTGSGRCRCLSECINNEVWGRTKFRLWVLGLSVCIFGYSIPFNHIKNFSKSMFPDREGDSDYLIVCLNAASFVGRILAGFLGDISKFSRMYLQQFAFAIMGAAMICMANSPTFQWLAVFCATWGLGDGMFISLVGPISTEICGERGTTQAVGSILGVSSIFAFLGSFTAGAIYDSEKTYTVSFVAGGALSIIGSLVLFSEMLKCAQQKQPITLQYITVEVVEKEAESRSILQDIIPSETPMFLIEEREKT